MLESLLMSKQPPPLSRTKQIYTLPVGVNMQPTAVGGGFVHYAGGIAAGGVETRYRKLELATGIVTSSAVPPSTSSWCGGAFDGTYFWTFTSLANNGYQTASNYSLLVRRWNPADMTWVDAITTIPGPLRAMVRVEYYAGNIYVLGGHTSAQALSKLMYKYNIASNSWSQIADMPYTANGHSTAMYGDKLILMGGYSGSVMTDVWQYNTTNNAWTKLSDAPYGHCWVGGTIWRNLVLVVANNGVGNTVFAMIYNLDTGVWRSYQTTIPQRWGASLVPTEQGVLMVGGGAEYVVGPNFDTAARFTDVQLFY